MYFVLSVGRDCVPGAMIGPFNDYQQAVDNIKAREDFQEELFNEEEGLLDLSSAESNLDGVHIITADEPA